MPELFCELGFIPNPLRTRIESSDLLQVDLLKSTALPLMKKFGIEGEGFELKVRTFISNY